MFDNHTILSVNSHTLRFVLCSAWSRRTTRTKDYGPFCYPQINEVGKSGHMDIITLFEYGFRSVKTLALGETANKGER